MTRRAISVSRYHDFSYGHRVTGHEGKCCNLHGHNGRVTFTCAAIDHLDHVGRVIDFGVIKDTLCNWVEENWDHNFLLWEQDPKHAQLFELFPESIVSVPFNPTAENMADFLLLTIGPRLLKGKGVELLSVKMEETRKCSATSSKSPLYLTADEKPRDLLTGL